jgi:hypothetical protein
MREYTQVKSVTVGMERFKSRFDNLIWRSSDFGPPERRTGAGLAAAGLTSTISSPEDAPLFGRSHVVASGQHGAFGSKAVTLGLTQNFRCAPSSRHGVPAASVMSARHS